VEDLDPESRVPSPECRVPSPERYSYEGMYVIGLPALKAGVKMSVRANPSMSRPSGRP
jgi:hypothetical protein